jgi:processive 1,2-diacylglycerol beta-glucosyltransferase
VEIYRQLLRSQKTFQVVVICGKNEELKVALEQIAPPSSHPVKIYGYTEEVDKIMSACDVMVGKTGGPTMGEAIIKHLPMVLTDIMPGHEEENLRFLLDHNVVEYGRIPREVVFLVEEFLDGKRAIDWDNAHETVLRPKGAVNIADALGAIRPQPQAKIRNYQET